MAKTRARIDTEDLDALLEAEGGDDAGNRFETRPSQAEAEAEHLQQQLADQRAVRAELARDLEEMRDRIDGLERAIRAGRWTGANGPGEADEVAEMRTRLADAHAQLDAARDRVAYLERRIVELQTRLESGAPKPAGQAAAPVVRPPQPPSGAKGARIAAAVLLAAGLGAGATAAALAGDTPSPAARPPVAAAPEPATPVVPAGPGSCDAQPADAAEQGPVTCSTGTVLTIVTGSEPLVLPGLALRVMSAQRTATGATLRVRLRAEGPEPRALGSDQIYLSAAGRRVFPTNASSGVIPAGQARRATLRFALSPATRSALAAAGWKVDVGVLPLQAAGDRAASRLGVVKLTLGRAG